MPDIQVNSCRTGSAPTTAKIPTSSTAVTDWNSDPADGEPCLAWTFASRRGM